MFDLTTDGTEAKQTNSQGSSTASVVWGDVDGTRLILTVTRQSPGGKVVTERVMKLGAEGKMLTTVLAVDHPTDAPEANEFYTRR